MDKKKQYKRYSLPVKILILTVLIISTVVTGISAAWMSLGLWNDMTIREVLNPVPYEQSQTVATYIIDEAHQQFERIENDEAEPATDKIWMLPGSEQTNLMFYLKDVTSGDVYTNQESWGTMDLMQISKAYKSGMHGGSECYFWLNEEMGTESYDSVMSSEAERQLITWLGEWCWNVLWDRNDDCQAFQVFLGVNTRYPVKNSIARARHEFFDEYLEYSTSKWYYMGFASLGIMLWMLILVACQAGHCPEDRKIHMKLIDRFPLEIWMIVDVILILIGCVILLGEGTGTLYDSIYWNGERYVVNVLPVFVRLAAQLAGGGLILSLTLAKMLNLYGRRIKAGMLGGSLILFIQKTLVKWLRNLYGSRKESQKLILRFILVLSLNVVMAWIFLLLAESTPGAAFFLLLLWLIIDIYILYRLVKNDRGRDGIKAGLAEISQGNLEYQIDTTEMSQQNREMAEKVNRMRDGLRMAVDTQLKSERLKTDLIANVSHDIKTPLTSIINYVDILDREHFEDPRIAGYVDILVRKSARLKQLTDDLIEASKISSGNISLDIQEINLKQLIKQTNGEFEEKFGARHLQLICDLPEEQLLIRADGRRMYRVLENLYQNVAKYAMPYSRVYVSGETKEGIVTFSIKNMSENPLNVSVDELMERFVRGDASRTTEGSGLGLEIARNLTVMQHGTFNLYVDGDLFKVILVFGLKEEEVEPSEEEAPPEKKPSKSKLWKKKVKLPKIPRMKIRFKKPVIIERVETDHPEKEE